MQNSLTDNYKTSKAVWDGQSHTALFSIVIPAYNAGRYVERCLRSVQGQGFGDFECIVVNDGSTDDTLAVCRRTVEGDGRFVVLDMPNGGVSNARNSGLDFAKGKYVLFVDADDWVEPTWLEELSKVCEGEVDVVQFDFYEASDSAKTEIHIDSDRAMIVQGEGAVVWKRAYRRALIGNLRFDTSLCAGEDYLFSVQVFLRCQSYRHLGLCLYNYYVDNVESTMHRDLATNFGHQLIATGHVERLLKELGLYEEHNKDLRRRYHWCIRVLGVRWLERNMQPGRKRRFAVKRFCHYLKKGL